MATSALRSPQRKGPRGRVRPQRQEAEADGKGLADEHGPNGKRQRLILPIDEGAFTKKWEMRFVETTPAFSGWRARGEKRWRLTAAREAAMGEMREEALLKAAGVDKLAT